MADIRNQVNEARRAGYSDDEIAQFLSSKEPRIQEAIKSGYSAKEVVSFLAPEQTTGETAARMVGAAGKESGPTAVAATLGGAVGGLPGAVLGSYLYPVSDAAVQAYNTIVPERFKAPVLPSQGMQRILETIGVGGTKPETRGERISAAAGGALTGAIPAVVPRMVGATAPGSLGTLMSESGRAPVTQLASSAPIGATTQYVTEATGSPVLGLATGATAGTLAGFRPRTKGSGVTADEMSGKISQAYQKATDAGLQIDVGSYRNRSFGLDTELRQAGWRPDNPELDNITNLVTTLRNESGPKDLQQLMDLRQAIKMSANPNDPNAYRLMKIVLNDFDDYLDNLPKQSILAGDAKEGTKAWFEARKLFNQEKKAETFETMLSNLNMESNKFSQSGAENYLANELRKLAKNDKQMRLFSKAEQAEIKKAAEGGSLQNMLRYIGRFAPVGAIPQIGSVAMTAANPYLGLIPAAGMGARVGAEQIRIGDVERLMDLMRTGTRPASPFQNIPATLSRGLLSTELE
jgi:hypothetical protein